MDFKDHNAFCKLVFVFNLRMYSCRFKAKSSFFFLNKISFVIPNVLTFFKQIIISLWKKRDYTSKKKHSLIIIVSNLIIVARSKLHISYSQQT